MLKRLLLRNFKSWQEATLDFRRITGLFGVNSSGKSGLAQFLLLLKQTREAGDRATTLELNGRFVRLGTPADIIHAHVVDALVLQKREQVRGGEAAVEPDQDAGAGECAAQQGQQPAQEADGSPGGRRVAGPQQTRSADLSRGIVEDVGEPNGLWYGTLCGRVKCCLTG